MPPLTSTINLRADFEHQMYRSQLSSWIHKVQSGLYILWLFTCSDLKTMVFPSTFFALFNGIAFKSDKHIGLTPDLSAWELTNRLPLVVIWAWTNLLAFNISNQRRPTAIKEDSLNKSWRPIPSGRITAEQARTIGMLAHPAAFFSSLVCQGGLAQSVILLILGYAYNDLNGGEVNFITRNLINACGFTCFLSGALDVFTRSQASSKMLSWFLLIAATVFTTVHTQDMYDQLGDRAVGRKTVPLVFGDRLARWSIAVTVFVWSWLCPMFWMGKWPNYVTVVGLGLWICLRTLRLTTVRDDRTTFVIYNLWLVAIYALPVTRSSI